MKKSIAAVCIPLFAASLFAQGRGGGFGFGRPEIVGIGPGRAPVTGAPYSGTETTTRVQTLADGNTITHVTAISVARDSQGRISTSETITPPASSGQSPFTVETIFDPVAGYEYRLNSSTMTAIQTPLPKPGTSAPKTARPAPPANPNATTAQLGTSVVNAVQATGTGVTVTIPAGAMGNAQAITSTRVTWISTALQVPVQIKTSDPRFATTDMELTNIVQAEPNASLFAVPSGYTVQQGRGPGGRGFGGPGGPGPGPSGFRRSGGPLQ